VVPVYTSILSASSDAAKICDVEFNPPVCDEFAGPNGEDADHTTGRCLSESVAQLSFEWNVPKDLDLLYSYGHAHIGTLDGVKATMVETFEGMDFESELCHSKPTFGTGVEDSFLTGMSGCSHIVPMGGKYKALETLNDFDGTKTEEGSIPMRLPAGSTIRVSGKYWAASRPYEVNGVPVEFSAPFDGSMIYFIMAYAFPDGYAQFDDLPVE